MKRRRARAQSSVDTITSCAGCDRVATSYCQVETSTRLPIWKCHDCIVTEIKDSKDGTAAELDRVVLELSETKETLRETLRKKRFLGLSYDCNDVLENDKGDIQIVVQGHTLYAHKYVLSQRSPVFKRMFDSDLSEKFSSIIYINDATTSVMEAVINSFYNAKIEFDSKDVTPEEVLNVAHKYDVHYLKRVCEKAMTATMDEDNLTTRLKLAKKLDCKKLQRATEEFLKSNFDRLISKVLDDLLQ